MSLQRLSARKSKESFARLVRVQRKNRGKSVRISSSTVALIAAFQIAIGAFAHAGESDLLRAAEDLDVKALTFLMATAKDPNERHFAKGVIAATMNDDVGAEINLEATAIAASLPQPIRCKALGLLAGVFLRQTRFADAAKRWDAAQNLGSCGAPGPEEVRSRAVALTLQGDTGDAHRRRDGILGQDVLTSGRGYVLDFGNMRLELLEKQ